MRKFEVATVRKQTPPLNSQILRKTPFRASETILTGVVHTQIVFMGNDICYIFHFLRNLPSMETNFWNATNRNQVMHYFLECFPPDQHFNSVDSQRIF